ncbi:unnamed protein product [Prunus armeniaca]
MGFGCRLGSTGGGREHRSVATVGEEGRDGSGSGSRGSGGPIKAKEGADALPLAKKTICRCFKLPLYLAGGGAQCTDYLILPEKPLKDPPFGFK